MLPSWELQYEAKKLYSELMSMSYSPSSVYKTVVPHLVKWRAEW